MPRRLSRARPARSWRTFPTEQGHRIDQEVREGQPPRCPCCGHSLEARSASRLAHALPLDAVGFDLNCRGCRRFWCVVRHGARSLRLLRMRRLAAAVRAA